MITLLLLGGLINPLIAVGAVQIRDFDLEKPAEPCSDLNAVDFDEGDHAYCVIEINPFFTIAQYSLDDGTSLLAYNIAGPPQPPPGFEAERAASIMALPSRGVLPEFPSYNWVFGCSAVAAAMIAGYHDRNGYDMIYTGPTNSGEMPLTDTVWPQWTDSAGASYVSNPLVASKMGLDGRVERGPIDNYWVSCYSTALDPYITHSWAEHQWGSAIGDYMKTSQSAYGTIDGSTWFFNDGFNKILTCASMEEIYYSPFEGYIADFDGTYGRKEFYEARGYTVTDCYNQKTDNLVSGGFSLEDFKAEIDAGYPVLLNLKGHSLVGYGYSGSTIYIRDTWSSDPNETLTMTWGGSYYGMALQSVSVVRLAPLPEDPPPTEPPDTPTGVSASQGTCNTAVQISWDACDKATYYKIYRNTSDEIQGATELASQTIFNPHEDRSAIPGKTYYYWVKACNEIGCSEYSTSAFGWRGDMFMLYLPLITR